MSPIALVREGDRARLKGAVVTLHDFVWRVLRGCGLSPDEADDATQEVFAVLASKISEIEAGAEKSYLFRTANHVASNVRRRRARWPVQAEDHELHAHPDPTPNPETLVDAHERVRLFDTLLTRLSDEYREAFILCELESTPLAEAAAILDAPIGTVASRVRRARQKLAAWMQELSPSAKKDAP